jgi:hypothetical protein
MSRDPAPRSSVVLAVAPAEVDRLTGVSRFADVVTPVRLATLDVGLRSLPRPRTLLALGVDEPVYFSVHSVTARLAPAGGALNGAERISHIHLVLATQKLSAIA